MRLNAGSGNRSRPARTRLATARSPSTSPGSSAGSPSAMSPTITPSATSPSARPASTTAGANLDGFTSATSLSDRSASTTPSANGSFPSVLYDRRGLSTSSDGSQMSARGSPHLASTSGGVPNMPSSNTENSTPVNNGFQVDGEDWHAAFNQTPEEEDNDTEESMINDDDDHNLSVEFNSIGQPVGVNSKSYATQVGKVVRSFIPPGFESWTVVPSYVKEDAWRSIKNSYNVPDFLKEKFLKMANKSWKNRKSTLRKKCDEYDTVAERKSHRPPKVKAEDWDAFVDMVNTEEDRILRVIGRESRSQVKALHTTGRDGIARRRYKMEQQSPTGSVTRTYVYLQTHEYQPIPEEQLVAADPESYEVKSRKLVAKVRELYETEQYRNETHLDRDAVAMVFGPDDRGCVRGIGGGISKTELIASAISREQLRQEKLKTRAYEEHVRTLQETVQVLKMSVQNSVAQQMNGTSAPDPAPAAAQPSVRTVLLKNMRKKTVAVCRLDQRVPPPNDEDYLVLIDEIILEHEYLCDGEGTFETVQPGDQITWPRHYVTII